MKSLERMEATMWNSGVVLSLWNSGDNPISKNQFHNE